MAAAWAPNAAFVYAVPGEMLPSGGFFCRAAPLSCPEWPDLGAVRPSERPRPGAPGRPDPIELGR